MLIKKERAKGGSRADRMKGGGLIYCLRDLEIVFSEGLLDEITELYEQGYSVEIIADEINRDPDEVFIGLFHQARQGKTGKPFGQRI